MEAISFLQDVAGFAQATSGPKPRARLATVDPSYVASSFLSGTLPKVTFDGESTLSGKTYPVMAPYWPHPSDRVTMLPFVVGNSIKYVILGTLDDDGSLRIGGGVDVAAETTTQTLRVRGTVDATLTSTLHPMQIGASSGQNLRMDTNEIQSVNNGAAGNLLVNQDGGTVLIGTTVNESGQIFHAQNVQKRIATTVATSDGSSSAGEVVAATVVASLVSGRIYRVTFDSALEGGTAGDRMLTRIREDNVSGTALQTRQTVRSSVSGTTGDHVRLEGEFTAASTGNKTFVATHDNIGANAINTSATSEWPTYLYVDYVRG